MKPTKTNHKTKQTTKKHKESKKQLKLTKTR